MRTFKALLKKDFILNVNRLFSSDSSTGSKEKWKKIIAIAAFALIFGFYMWLMLKALFLAFSTEVSIKEQMTGVLIAIIFPSIVVLIRGLSAMQNMLFFNDDVKILLRLPIKSKFIYMSKLIYQYISGQFWVLFLSIPIIINIGLVNHKDFMFYVLSILGVILNVIITVTIFTFVITLLMSVLIKVKGIKKIIQYVISILGIIFILFVNYVSRTTASSGDFNTQLGIQLKSLFARLGDTLNNFAPHMKYYIDAIFKDNLTGLIALALLIALTVLLIIITSKIASPLFININTYESGLKKAKIRQKDYKKKSPLRALIKKEVGSILSEPIFAFNMVVVPFIVIISGGMSFFAQQKLDTGIDKIREALDSKFIIANFGEKYLIYILLGIGLILGIFLSINSIVSYSIGREKGRIWLMQTLPIKAKTQYLSRLIPSIIAHILIIVPILIILKFISRIELKYYFILFIEYIITGTFIMSFAAFIDVLYPKFDWKIPKHAYNKNIKAIVIVMLFYIILIAMIIWPAISIISSKYSSSGLTYLLTAINVIMVIGIALFSYFTMKFWNKKIREYRV